MTPSQPALQSFLRSIGCEGHANDAASLAFARKVVEALGEPGNRARMAGADAWNESEAASLDERMEAADRVWKAMLAARFGR